MSTPAARKMHPIRNTVRALIVDGEKVLMTKLIDEQGYWYVLPGGGQDPGESLEEALQRECLEEIGTEIALGSLVYVREYIAKHGEFPWSRVDLHQVEFVFACFLKEGAQPGNGSSVDANQVGVEWLKIEELDSYRVYPLALRSLLHQTEGLDGAAYFGVVRRTREGLESQTGRE